MTDCPPPSRRLSPALFRVSFALLAAASTLSCGNSSGPSVAVTLNLYTVDRNFLPAAIKGTDGRTMTIGVGRLQGTDLGPSCGMSLQLNTGPITTLEVPNCRLATDKEFTFTLAITDPRFPSGPHEYRFIQP